MSPGPSVTVARHGTVAIVSTEGYIDIQGGEAVAKAAYGLMDEGFRAILFNLRGTKIINDIGIGILIEIIEKMIEVGGRVSFCGLSPTISKTFAIMGLGQYAAIYADEDTAMAALSG